MKRACEEKDRITRKTCSGILQFQDLVADLVYDRPKGQQRDYALMYDFQSYWRTGAERS